MNNTMTLEFLSISENEAFARAAVSAFISQINPTLDELDDIKTAVSEAVTNAIIHGYKGRTGMVHITCILTGQDAVITISDTGRGMVNVDLARTPLYTEDTDGERSGLGFTVMETFMDTIEVVSSPGEGTIVTMKKSVGAAKPVAVLV